MRYITDWHIHSKYSRACSRDLELPMIAKWCEKKGIDVVGTGDWTHPKWFAHLKENLEESEPGIYRLKTSPDPSWHNLPLPLLRKEGKLKADSPPSEGGVRGGRASETRFMLVQEVSQIYKKNEKTRRIHNLIFSPSLETCEKVNAWLTDRDFNLASDGRPILGIDSEELYRELKGIDERVIVIPAHAWTPWYSVFGSKSGFDSLEECFGEMTPYIYAVETGLSSNPEMNWRLSGLDKVVMVSNSDAHSPGKLGREANVFDLPALSFDAFVEAMKAKDPKRFLYTIEFFPEEGKYHFDGCANCQFSCAPKESKRLGCRCPKCGKPLVLGVEHRVEALADREVTPEIIKRKIPYKSIVPLEELLAECFGVSSASSKKVKAEYDRLIEKVGSEFHILLDARFDEIAKVASDPSVVEAIRRVREGKVVATPGYDGIFGKIKVFDESGPQRPKQVGLL